MVSNRGVSNGVLDPFDFDPRTVPIRPASTVAIVRNSPRFEVLLCRRQPTSAFVANMQVFPGGGVDPADSDMAVVRSGESMYPGGPDLGACRRAAIRETQEETGLVLSDDVELPVLGRWITPPLAPRRYDTVFFVAALPDGQEPVADGVEVVECTWWTPEDAVQAWADDKIEFVTPTLRMMMSLQGFDSAEQAIAAVSRAQLPGYRVRVDDETGWPWLPGDKSFEDPGLRRTFGWVSI